MKQDDTFSTGFLGASHDYTESTVLSNGDVVIWGRTTLDWAFQTYNSQTGTRLKEIRGLCDHYKEIRLLSLAISGAPYLAVLCLECKLIRLVNLNHPNGEHVEAFKWNEESLGPMCLGPPSILYLADMKSECILVIDCTETMFVKKTDIPFKGMPKPNSMIYIEDRNIIALCSYAEGRIYALNGEGNLVWNTKEGQHLEEEFVQPGRLSYLADRGWLLVTDSPNQRILVLDASNGAWVETLRLEEKIRNVHTMRDGTTVHGKITILYFRKIQF